jgi:hypothetical protein
LAALLTYNSWTIKFLNDLPTAESSLITMQITLKFSGAN